MLQMLVKSTQHNKNTLQSSNNANAGKISYSPATMQMLVKYPTATMQIITTVQQTKSGKQMLVKSGKQNPANKCWKNPANKEGF